MTIAGTTSNSLASLLSSTLSSVNGSNSSTGGTGSTGSASLNGSPISVGPIDVNSLVSELMTVESQPLTQLQSQQSGVQAKLSAYGQVQSSLSSLDTAIAALKTNSAFSATAATVTGLGVGATVTGTAAPGSYSVVVSQVAQAQTVASTTAGQTASSVVGDGVLSIKVGTAAAVPITINAGNDTLGGIAAAINNASAGVNASVVTDTTGSRLVLTASNTGTANAFTVTAYQADGTTVVPAGTGLGALTYPPGTGGGMTQAQAALDANYTVNGLALTSSTNSVTTAINGVTLNLTQAPPAGSTLQAQITVATDTTTVTGNVNSFITAYNNLVNLENSLTSYNASTNTASTLTGDTPMFQLSSQLNSILGSQMSGAASGAPSWLASVGITFQRNGTLSLNSSTFQSALASNPNGVAKMFTNASGSGTQQGFAVRMASAVESMLSPNGLVGGTQTSLQSTIDSMNNKITAMQAQLTQTQQQLITQYSQLNAAMVTAQQNQVALANALAGLPA